MIGKASLKVRKGQNLREPGAEAARGLCCGGGGGNNVPRGEEKNRKSTEITSKYRTSAGPRRWEKGF